MLFRTFPILSGLGPSLCIKKTHKQYQTTKSIIMKKVIFLVVSLFYSIVTFAQEIHSHEVPSIVLNTFKQKFPKASDMEWELKNTEYKVEFEIGSTDHEAWLDKSGNIVKHKQDITSNELPKEVTASINKNYKDSRIDDVEKIELGEKVVFKVELKNASKEENLVFDRNGKLVEINCSII